LISHTSEKTFQQRNRSTQEDSKCEFLNAEENMLFSANFVIIAQNGHHRNIILLMSQNQTIFEAATLLFQRLFRSLCFHCYHNHS